jgi:hypothetical protein
MVKRQPTKYFSLVIRYSSIRQHSISQRATVKDSPRHSVHFLELDVKMPIHGTGRVHFHKMTKSVIMSNRKWRQNMSNHIWMTPINFILEQFLWTVIMGMSNVVESTEAEKAHGKPQHQNRSVVSQSHSMFYGALCVPLTT